MSTVRDLIIGALVEIGYMGADDALDPADAVRALTLFRSMLDRYQGTRLQLYTEQRDAYALTANQQTRTIGAGGDFNGPRPVRILDLRVLPVGATSELPVHPMSRTEWYAEPNKTLTLVYPLRFLYEPAFPLGVFTFWPIPTTPATLQIAHATALTALSSSDTVALSTTLSLPPTYDEAWRLNLAKRYSRPFVGVPVSPDLAFDANEALGVVKRLNDDGPPAVASDPALAGRGRWDILTGRYRER